MTGTFLTITKNLQGVSVNGDKRVGTRLADVISVFCVIEFLALSCGGGAANALYSYKALNWLTPWPEVAMMSLILSAAMVTRGLLRGEYERCATQSPALIVWSALTSASRGFALLLLVIFVLRPADSVSRGSTLSEFAVVVLLAIISRSLFSLWIRRNLASGRLYLSRALIIGDSGRISDTAEKSRFFDTLRSEYVEVACIKALPPAASPEAEAAMLAKAVADCREGSIDSVVIIPTAETIALAERLVSALSETPVTVHVLPFATLSDSASASTRIGGQPSIAIVHSPVDSINRVLKRGSDAVLASLLMFMLVPLFLAVAAAIKIESRGPVFFRQTRHGYGNRYFKVFKFRSMRVMEDGSAFRQATKNDSRITKVGRFIRRTNLDELPQLMNVIMGDMSLVGPRPHPVALNEEFAARIRLFHRRHNIAPGITGWAQVNGFRGETDTDEKMHKRVQHDLWYIDNWSFTLDCRILFLTVFSSLAYHNAG